MIGAPVTKREKLLFYTVGLPWLLASIACNDAKLALRRVMRRLRACAQKDTSCVHVRAGLWLDPLGRAIFIAHVTCVDARLPSTVREKVLQITLFWHEADLFHYCFADESQPRAANVKGLQLIGPDMFVAAFDGGATLVAYRITNIDEFRADVKRIISQRGKVS